MKFLKGFVRIKGASWPGDAPGAVPPHLEHVRSIQDCLDVFETESMFSEGTLSDDVVSALYSHCAVMRRQGMAMEPNLIGRAVIRAIAEPARVGESDLSAFFVKSTMSDTVFLDIGANFGYFTCLVASRIGASGSGKVIAVEPNPRMHGLMSRNIRINWSMAPVETHACAITVDGTSVDLVIPADSAVNAHIMTEGVGRVSGSNVLHVPGNTVDRIVAGRRVDLIKIDVEGHELDVLNGANETFRAASNIHVVMEWSMNQMNDVGINPGIVMDKFDELGLAYYHLPESIHVSNAELEPLRLSREQLLLTPYTNIYLRKFQ